MTKWIRSGRCMHIRMNHCKYATIHAYVCAYNHRRTRAGTDLELWELPEEETACSLWKRGGKSVGIGIIDVMMMMMVMIMMMMMMVMMVMMMMMMMMMMNDDDDDDDE
jgi:hypothetical protein